MQRKFAWGLELSKDCFEAIVKGMFKEDAEDVPKSLIKTVVSDLEKLKADVEKGKYKNETYKSKAAEYIAEKRRLNENQLLMKTLNLEKTKKELEFLRQEAFKDNPTDAFKSSLVKAMTLANRGNDSITARSAARLGKYQQYLFTEVEKLGHADVFISRQIDREILNEVFDRASGGKGDISGNKAASEIGAAMHNLNKLWLQEYRDAGIPTREMMGYMMRQTHDPLKMPEFGQWYSSTLPKLDPVKTFGVDAGDPKAVKEIMEKIYKRVKAGVYGIDDGIGNKDVGDNFVGLGATKSLADKLSEARTLHFSSADKFYEYNLEFGKGGVAENIAATMQRNARDLSMFERYGDKPAANFAGNIERMATLLEREGNTKALANLNRNKQYLLDLYKTVSQTKATPGNGTVANITSGILALQAGSKLGALPLRSLANFAGTAVEIKNIDGRNFLDEAGHVALKWIQSIPEGMRQTWGKSVAEDLDIMHMESIRNMGLYDGAPGMAHRTAGWLSKYGGADLSNNTTAYVVATRYQSILAEHSGKAFSSLDPKMQARLLEHGITDPEYKLFAKAVETAENGRRFVTPEAMGKLIPEDVRGAMEAMEYKGSAAKFINELELKYRGMLHQSSMIATTTAGEVERAFLTMGKDPGTDAHALLSLLTQFKSFTIQGLNIGRRFVNANPDPAKLQTGTLVSKGSDLQSVAAWVLAGTAAAYVGDTIIRYLNGKERKDPMDVKTWVDAMAKSGAGGMHVDFVAGEWDKYSFGQTMLGPTFGQVPEAAEIFTDAKQGDLKGGKFDRGKYSKGALPGTTSLIRNNIPFQNVPLIKRGFDYLHYDLIDGAINPRSKQRRELLNEKRKLTKGE